jgi:hypothetical protein
MIDYHNPPIIDGRESLNEKLFLKYKLICIFFPYFWKWVRSLVDSPIIPYPHHKAPSSSQLSAISIPMTNDRRRMMDDRLIKTDDG